MIEAYRRAWERILAEQDGLVGDPAQASKLRRLRAMEKSIVASMDALDADLDEWIAERFPQVYLEGMRATAGATGTDVIWSAINQEAVERLAYGMYEDLLGATSFVRDSTKSLIRTIAENEGLFSVIGGNTAQQAGRNMARLIEEQGIAAVVYRNGARHGLAEYSEMAMRTTTALGFNEGSLNQAPEVVYWEVFDGPDCGWSSHDDLTLANGLIVTADEARAFPISHPNCRRGFGPRPDITSQQQINELSRGPNIGSGQTTFGQRQAQIEADRLRSSRSRTPRQPRNPEPTDDQLLLDAAAARAEGRAATREGFAIDQFDGQEYPITKFPTVRQADGTYIRGGVTRANLPAYREAKKAERAAAKARAPRSTRTPRATTAPTPTAPAAGFRGVNPSTVVDIRAGATTNVGRSVDDALESIGKVHRAPDGMHRVPVSSDAGRTGPYGSYHFGTVSGEVGSRVVDQRGVGGITIRANGDHRGSTFTHEFGHYLDHQGSLFGQGRGFWGTDDLKNADLLGIDPIDPRLKRLRDAWEESPTIKSLRAVPQDQYSKYYLQRNETWARTYAQWVALRSGDPVLIREIEDIVNGGGIRGWSQWPADEFEPIAAVMDEIFGDLL